MTEFKDLPPLSAAQLEVMNAVWEKDDASVSDVWHKLRERRPVARATVQTMLNRLTEKGWLNYRAVGQAYLYSAAVPREATQEHLVSNLVNTAFDGSVEGLMWALLSDRGLSKDEAGRIRSMIEEAEQKTKRRGK